MASQATRTLRYALPFSLSADVNGVLVDSGRATGRGAHPTATMWGGAEGGEGASFRFNFGGDDDNVGGGGRGLHSFASQLTLSDVNGIGGARKDCVARSPG